MRIIDGHIHVGKWSKIFFGYETNLIQAIDVMKSAGVEAAVCIPADNEPNEKLLKDIESQNLFKFYTCAWINPDDGNLDNFLKNKIQKIDFFKFHPSIQKRKIADEGFRKYLEIAQERRIPVIVHCGRWQEMAGFKIPADLSVDFPSLNFILAHLGGDQPGLYLECADYIKNKKLKNVYLGTESVREFYFVEKLVKTVGADKVIFGSDYNLGLPHMYIPVIEHLNIPAGDKELIFAGNILRIMKNTP